MTVSSGKRFQRNKMNGKSHQLTIEIVIPKGKGNTYADGMNKQDYRVFDVICQMKRSIKQYMKMVNGEAKFYSENVLIR